MAQARASSTAFRFCARHVLGEREVEPLPVVGLAQHRRDQLELGDPRGAQPALAGDQLVAPPASGRTTIGCSTPRARIDSASSASLVSSKLLPRLARVGVDQVDGDLPQPVLVAGARKDRGEAAAHAPPVVRHERLAYDLFAPHPFSA